MKRVSGLILLIVMIGALLCSCGSAEIEEIILSNNDINLSVGDSSYINFTVRPRDTSKRGIVWSSSN